MENPVIFAGAGPGDPDLVTVKTQKALMAADLVIYAGSLVPEALLSWTKDQAETVNSASMNLDEIIAMVEKGHAANRKIVRLHTGDPSLYGAIFEQTRELEARGIPFTVIPGVTAGFGAAAAMGMEYTLPEVTQTLIFTRISGRTPVPEEESLDSLAAHKASMAIYLSIAHVEQVQKILARHYGQESLVAIAHKVSHPDEKIVTTPVRDLARTVKKENIQRQALILAGKAVAACTNRSSIGNSLLYDPAFSHGFRK